MPVVQGVIVGYGVVAGRVEVDSMPVVRAYGVVGYDVVAGIAEVDSIVVVRACGVVGYGVVAGRGEEDPIVVVRSNYILYSTVIRAMEANSSFRIDSCPGHCESFDGNIICSHVEYVVVRIGSLNNTVSRTILRLNR